MRQSMSFIEPEIMKDARNFFINDKKDLVGSGEKFMRYFLENCTPEGILFKTMKEITAELDLSYLELVDILRILKNRQIIYRRNGIIGLWKY
ncbi:replication/maintenance protein RepL [Planococcus sp. YIM B11945]|uniref:replication/maintenance protein RepL n=1 Tax=Planococcus sp. YIM B11945 TaxID=3435410 RepID=UPI003D7D4FD1